MNETLSALAREVAATGDGWIRPGVACVDPETGARYRRNDWGWCDADGIHADPDEEPGPHRARAAGPDLADAASLGVLTDLIARARNGGRQPIIDDWANAVNAAESTMETAPGAAIARTFLALLRKETQCP